MRFFTAGESHGSEMIAIIEGLPSGILISLDTINYDLYKRQKCYGRSERMEIENDKVLIKSGIKNNITLGTPLTLIIKNKDFNNNYTKKNISIPIPGTAGLVGSFKYKYKNINDVLERSSARETVLQVAIGSIAKSFLNELGIKIVGYVIQIGNIKIRDLNNIICINRKIDIINNSKFRILDKKAEKDIKNLIDNIKKNGDTVGGIIEIIVDGKIPKGLGSYVQWDRKLDAKIAFSILSVNSLKGVEFGLGFKMANLFGSEIIDEIFWEKSKGYIRKSNNSGGFEGGMTTGMPIIIRGIVKPIPTLSKTMYSINIKNKKKTIIDFRRSDYTAVIAASLVCESVVAIELMKSILNEFYANSLLQIKKRFNEYINFFDN